MTFQRHLIACTFTAAALLAAPAMALTQAEYSAAKSRISSEYTANKGKCSSLSGNAKDICHEEAKGVEKVAKADLEAQYQPTEKNHYKAREARADADYGVAKEKCDDLSGNPKDVCVKDAKAAHVNAIQNAKVVKAMETPADTNAEKGAAVAEARKDASAEKNEASYKAAKERCDALAGDIKSKCVDDAKRTYGQK